MKFDTELTMSKPFGPWMLRGKLPKEILDKMLGGDENIPYFKSS